MQDIEVTEIVSENIRVHAIMHRPDGSQQEYIWYPTMEQYMKFLKENETFQRYGWNYSYRK